MIISGNEILKRETLEEDLRQLSSLFTEVPHLLQSNLKPCSDVHNFQKQIHNSVQQIGQIITFGYTDDTMGRNIQTLL